MSKVIQIFLASFLFYLVYNIAVPGEREDKGGMLDEFGSFQLYGIRGWCL